MAGRTVSRVRGGATKKAEGRAVEPPAEATPLGTLALGPGIGAYVGPGFAMPEAVYDTARLVIAKDGPFTFKMHVTQAVTRCTSFPAHTRHMIDARGSTVAIIYADWRTHFARVIRNLGREGLSQELVTRVRDVPFPRESPESIEKALVAWTTALDNTARLGSPSELAALMIEAAEVNIRSGDDWSPRTLARSIGTSLERLAVDMAKIGLSYAALMRWLRMTAAVGASRQGQRDELVARLAGGRATQTVSERFQEWFGLPVEMLSGAGKVVGLFGTTIEDQPEHPAARAREAAPPRRGRATTATRGRTPASR